MNHTHELARVLLQIGGETNCLCPACRELREGLYQWLSNSPISPDYTEEEAAADFWSAVDAVDPLLTTAR